MIIFTVAEANGVRIEEVGEWVSEKKGIFNSLFQFDHLNLWNIENTEGNISLIKLKQALTKWQNATAKEGNVALVMENHDLVRSINRFGSPDKYWKESAKCLALMYFMQKGVPFIYQGQEIGMLNADYESVLDFRDAPPICAYQDRMKKGMTKEESFQILRSSTRDNTRTPMQWDESVHSGFTKGNPWMNVNQNYKWLNVKQQETDADSILHFYKRIIKLRKEIPTLIYGKYDLLIKESESIYSYTRTYKEECYLIICNISENHSKVQIPFNLAKSIMVLGNYNNVNSEDDVLKPYECRMYKV